MEFQKDEVVMTGAARGAAAAGEAEILVWRQAGWQLLRRRQGMDHDGERIPIILLE